MSGRGIKIRIAPVAEREDGNTGHRWMVTVNFDGTPAYDASAVTIESALAECVRALAEALYASTQGVEE